MAAATSFPSLLLLLLLLALIASAAPLHDNKEDGLGLGIGIGIGIGIGGGGGAPGGAVAPPSKPGSNCPPPPHSYPPPPPPPPQPCTDKPSCFENMFLYRAYIIIQRFKMTITSDPKNIIRSWQGPNICYSNKNGRGYQGFYCDTPPPRRVKGKDLRGIASVDFNGFHLGAPTVSGFIDQLPDLAIFHANSNYFGGTVPFLTALPYFFELDVSNNRLSGSFPAAVSCLFNATFIDIRFNFFVGPIPSSVFLVNTTFLFLNNNRFTGNIPANLGSTPAAYLTFANNRFTGPIPHSIGATANTLLEVLFLNNLLDGCLPYEAGLLRKADVFDAGYNRITGPIPQSFGCLQKVEQLNLAGNLLYGEIPDIVCRLGTYGKLLNLSLSDNYFTSLGQSCRSLLACGKLDVRKNCIPGLPNKRPTEECVQFLKLPKVNCPNTNYIPCRLPWEGKEELGSSVSSSAAAALDGRQDKKPSSGAYRSYSALHV